MLRTVLSEYITRIRIRFQRRRIRVASLEETIAMIKDEGYSVSRFGDGEFYIMEGGKIGFQNSSPELAERLKEVISSEIPGHLVCISNGINPKNYKEFTQKHIEWMRRHFKNTVEMRLKYVDVNRRYGNLLISRFWIPFRDKDRARRIAEQLNEIWKDRDVVVIEGEKTRMGVGNDLLDDTRSCRRILCPAVGAFDKYDEILKAACRYPKDVLFMIALGPTATVLAYDLCCSGFQALDIGHIDLEYEWMKMGVSKQVDLPHKYVNELSGGDNAVELNDEKYLSQIDVRIR